MTRARIAADLGRLGVRPGSVLVVHSSLSALGWVCGRAQAVVEGLIDALGADGTLVVPAHTSGNCDPATWSNPPVPEDWWPVIRAEMPAFDPRVTPTDYMGAIAEVARTWPGALRSAHPQVSFASPCSGHGYKFATVIGEILADLATHGDTRHPIEMFSPHRFRNAGGIG